MNGPECEPSAFSESVVEDAALAWLDGLGHAVLHGPEIAVGMAVLSAPIPDTATWPGRRLRQALARLNFDLPPGA